MRGCSFSLTALVVNDLTTIINVVGIVFGTLSGAAIVVRPFAGRIMDTAGRRIVALAAGAELVLNTDAHDPGDLIGDEMARTILLGAGIPEDRLDWVFKKMQILANEAGAGLRTA